jgi:hypothetical protein
MLQDQKPSEKVEEEPRDIKKTPEYRKFKALLRKVVKAPPMPARKTKAGTPA